MLNLHPLASQLPFRRYFVKRGYCLLTSKIPSSPDLNKINIFLKQASISGFMYRKFEEYLAKLLFELPLPLGNTMVKLYLPPGDL